MNSNLSKKQNKNDLRELNTLPQLTWRWLKVNSLALKAFDAPKAASYGKDFLTSGGSDGITLKKMNHDPDINENLKYYVNTKEIYGVEEELTALGENHYNSGVFIHVPKDTKPEEPVRLVYSLDAADPAVIDNNIITVEENGEITLVIDYSTSDRSETFHNGVTRVYAKAGAVVNIVKIQRMNDKSLHFDSGVASIGRGAKVNWIDIELGARISATNIVNNLDETGSEAGISSIYFADGDRTVDISYLMNHRGRRTGSNIETRGALKDKSKKTFKGTIDFKNGAGRSKGREEEFAILLDKDVKASSIPLLLCSEDDVEGQHAASSGQIDSNKLFYIMSRGISEKEAKKLIVEASFAPIIDKIPFDDLKDIIREDIKRRLVDG